VQTQTFGLQLAALSAHCGAYGALKMQCNKTKNEILDVESRTFDVNFYSTAGSVVAIQMVI